MRILILVMLFILAGIFSTALIPVRADASSVVHHLRFAGLQRTYRLYRPAALAPSAPAALVIVLHGGFGTGELTEEAYHWDEQADAKGFVVAYPDGIGRTWNAGACCGAALRRNIDDVGFLTALITHLTHDEHLDPKRVFVTGMSNGAMMTYRLACESPFSLAAIGPVAGTLLVTCHDPQPVSVLHIHGLDDRYVLFAGGVGKGFDRSVRPSVPETIARWRAVDHCEAPGTQVIDSVTTESSRCAAGREVTLVTIAGAGHQWPGAISPRPIAHRLLGLDDPSTALDATKVLWTFFERAAAGRPSADASRR